MKLFQLCCRNKAKVENLSNVDKQPGYEAPYQYQVVITKKEKEKLTEEINRLWAEFNRREGAYEQIKHGMKYACPLCYCWMYKSIHSSDTQRATVRAPLFNYIIGIM